MDVGAVILAVSLPVAVLMAVRVRREDAIQRDAYIYAVAGGFAAFGVGWTEGFGLFALVFVPFAIILTLLDAFYRIFNVMAWFSGGNGD